jgi:hypothetical protein
MEAFMAKIFVNYRRDTSALYALSIVQYLEKEFGRERVFIDVDMNAGVMFPAVIERQLAQCNVLIALIDPDWLNAPDDLGHRRIDMPGDWVRTEIAIALRRGITVIPVCVGGATLPKRIDLPEDIRKFVDYQFMTVSTTNFRDEMSALVKTIRGIQTPWSFRNMFTAVIQRRENTVEASIMIRRSVDDVFKFYRNIDNLPRFSPGSWPAHVMLGQIGALPRVSPGSLHVMVEQIGPATYQLSVNQMPWRKIKVTEERLNRLLCYEDASKNYEIHFAPAPEAGCTEVRAVVKQRSSSFLTFTVGMVGLNAETELENLYRLKRLMEIER